MVWVGRDLKAHLVPTPLPWAGTSPTRAQVAQSSIQPGLETPLVGFFCCCCWFSGVSFFPSFYLCFPKQPAAVSDPWTLTASSSLVTEQKASRSAGRWKGPGVGEKQSPARGTRDFQRQRLVPGAGINIGDIVLAWREEIKCRDLISPSLGVWDSFTLQTQAIYKQQKASSEKMP